MNEVGRIIDYMGKLRKRNTIRNSDFRENQEERSKIRHEEEESKHEQNSQSRYPQNNQNGNQSLTNTDHELLFLCSQLIPLMDRTGRLLSGKVIIKI